MTELVNKSVNVVKYNPYHDGSTGRFTTGASVGVGEAAIGVGKGSKAATAAAKGLKHYQYSVPNDTNIGQADAFEAMKHDPSDPRVKKSYDQFEKTLIEQWDHLHKEGFTYSPQGDDPGYANSRDLMGALDGKHMKVYLTEGGGDFASDHPMLRPAPYAEKELGKGAVLNDVFRAVHDTIGHGVSGGSFGVQGERAAWIAHRETFPKEALPALWNETRGQAAWTNAGPHMQSIDISGNRFVLKKGDPGYLALPDRPFSEQKAGWPEGAKF